MHVRTFVVVAFCLLIIITIVFIYCTLFCFNASLRSTLKKTEQTGGTFVAHDFQLFTKFI